MVKSCEVAIIDKSAADPDGCASSFVSDTITVYVLVKGMVDNKAEISRLEKRNKFLEGEIKKCQGKMGNDKVPEDIKQQTQEKLTNYQNELEANLKSIDKFKAE